MNPTLKVLKRTAQVTLTGYAALCAAGLLAEPAQAAVITSGSGFVPITIGQGESKAVSFGGSVGSVFRFAQVYWYSGWSAVIQQVPPAGNRSVMLPGTCSYCNDPARVGGNYLVSAGRNWLNASVTNTGNDVAGISAGAWNGSSGPVQGYLGIRFQLADGYHYGFFDITYTNNPGYGWGDMIVNGWAYESDAGVGILTGPTGGGSGVPEPATAGLIGLGLLACGAAGLRRRRRAS